MVDEPIQDAVTKLLLIETNRKLVRPGALFIADPFVISLAQLHNLTGVSGEKPGTHSNQPALASQVRAKMYNSDFVSCTESMRVNSKVVVCEYAETLDASCL